ncbi:hypothetical protein MKX07_002935 [Trichoderma sp. CBMAI-0711]|nr:hypothetical protein MKX07_002935 [Trichoderma sp. CBMAI-0711]
MWSTQISPGATRAAPSTVWLAISRSLHFLTLSLAGFSYPFSLTVSQKLANELGLDSKCLEKYACSNPSLTRSHIDLIPKFITQEVKDQNRESQRRSRARRLELINDLKNQVEEYQRRGATASLEMQRLAQAVTHENQRLRSLLSERGVSQEEIQCYLSASSAPQFKLSDALYPSEPGSLRKTIGQLPQLTTAHFQRPQVSLSILCIAGNNSSRRLDNC